MCSSCQEEKLGYFESTVHSKANEYVGWHSCMKFLFTTQIRCKILIMATCCGGKCLHDNFLFMVTSQSKITLWAGICMSTCHAGQAKSGAGKLQLFHYQNFGAHKL